jgi:hypothetical protein
MKYKLQLPDHVSLSERDIQQKFKSQQNCQNSKYYDQLIGLESTDCADDDHRRFNQQTNGYGVAM